jgi:Fe2+ transport system protein FeoA
MRIVELKTIEDKILQKLAVFGIVPGNEITLLQSRPAYVLQIEYTQLAIDQLLASTIYGYKLK